MVRKKFTFYMQLACLLLISLNINAQGYGVRKIVIDAGHGGKDSGAIGSISKEKDIVLNVALLLGGYIDKYLDDVEVVYTRDDDTFIPLKERAEIANKAKADLFISIHANSIGGGRTSVYGAETFVMGTHKNESNLKIAQRENSVITFEDNYDEKYEGFDPTSIESYMIFNFMQNAYKEQSATLASLVQHQYTKRVGRKDREVQEAGFWVLAATTMPSILTELGFLSNPNEEKFLVSKQGQEFMASALFRAVRDYKKEIDAKQSLEITDAEKREEAISSAAPISIEPISSPTHDGITYKLQIFSSSEILSIDHPSVKDLKEVDYYVSGDQYKYTLGYSSHLREIKKLQKKYKNKYKGCFVVAFKKGKRISIDEAQSNL